MVVKSKLLGTVMAELLQSGCPSCHCHPTNSIKALKDDRETGDSRGLPLCCDSEPGTLLWQNFTGRMPFLLANLQRKITYRVKSLHNHQYIFSTPKHHRISK